MQTFPSASDLIVESKPAITPEVFTSDIAADAYDAALEGWGERASEAVGRICRWAASRGMPGVPKCPPPPTRPPR